MDGDEVHAKRENTWVNKEKWTKGVFYKRFQTTQRREC